MVQEMTVPGLSHPASSSLSFDRYLGVAISVLMPLGCIFYLKSLDSPKGQNDEIEIKIEIVVLGEHYISTEVKT